MLFCCKVVAIINHKTFFQLWLLKTLATAHGGCVVTACSSTRHWTQPTLSTGNQSAEVCDALAKRQKLARCIGCIYNARERCLGAVSGHICAELSLNSNRQYHYYVIHCNSNIVKVTVVVNIKYFFMIINGWIVL